MCARSLYIYHKHHEKHHHCSLLSPLPPTTMVVSESKGLHPHSMITRSPRCQWRLCEDHVVLHHLEVMRCFSFSPFLLTSEDMELAAKTFTIIHCWWSFSSNGGVRGAHEKTNNTGGWGREVVLTIPESQGDINETPPHLTVMDHSSPGSQRRLTG